MNRRSERRAPRLAGALALAALALGWALAARGQAAGQEPGEPAAGAPTDPGPLPPELAATMGAKAAGYMRRALGFTCLERVRATRYHGDEAGNEKVNELEYLLVRDPSQPAGVRAVRSRPGSRGQEVSSELHVPDPHLWTQLFDPAIRSTLRFRVGAWRTTPYKLVIPIEWESAAPVFEGRRITEWSGTVLVEYKTGNLVHLTAHPNLQDERLQAELQRYLTAFRIMGIATVAPPRGQELDVFFEYEHDKFTYPTRMELTWFQQVHRDARSIVSRQAVDYGEYRFFGTRVRDRIPPLLYPGPAGSPPPGSLKTEPPPADDEGD
ncbi:MAG: hypothetical protein KBD01_16680 [Acidobacteria bacterium]|nr:hypothetical protein [Acidobacteriota bacterium]